MRHFAVCHQTACNRCKDSILIIFFLIFWQSRLNGSIYHISDYGFHDDEPESWNPNLFFILLLSNVLVVEAIKKTRPVHESRTGFVIIRPCRMIDDWMRDPGYAVQDAGYNISRIRVSIRWKTWRKRKPLIPCWK